MKFVVTGALGHIGSRLIRTLPEAAPNADIVMIDNLRTQRYASLFQLPEGGRNRFIEADVTQMDIEDEIDGAYSVVHLAAVTDAAGSFQNREEVERVNLNATMRVAKACANTGVPMIHLSSTSVYGTQADSVDETCGPDELQPQSPYAETKLREEAALVELGRKKGLDFITLRFGTIAGTSPGMRFHTAVNKFCWQAVMNQPISVWRTALHQHRPYLSLSDAVRALVFILNNRVFDGRVYNILNENHTVSEIIERIRMNVPSLDVHFVDTPIMNQLSYHVRNDRFCGLGFQFRDTIGRCIDETLAWLRSAGNGWDPAIDDTRYKGASQ